MRGSSAGPLPQHVALWIERSGQAVRIDAAAFAGDEVTDRVTVQVAHIKRAALGDEALAIRRICAGRTVVVQRAAAALEVLEDLNAAPLGGVADIGELTALLLPAWANQPIERLYDGFGIGPELSPAGRLGTLFVMLVDELGRYDDGTVQRIAMLAGEARWQSRQVLLSLALARDAMQVTGRGAQPVYSSSELAFLTSRERTSPLKTTGSKVPIPLHEIDATLGPEGTFARLLDHFEHRAPQIAMAKAVSEALNHDGWLMAEAGTGTGKSLAYLVPAALFARERGERVVISTNTRALQDQLVTKDVPDVVHALGEQGGPPLSAAVLKGRANYLCLRRWFAAERNAPFSPADASMRAKVHGWLPKSDTGDRAELVLQGDEAASFSHVSAEGEACIPARCVFQQRNQCFLYRARRTAESAHVVVVNHALLLSDFGSGATILPEFSRLIIDEAHHLEDQATTQFGFSLSEAVIAEAIDSVIRMDAAGAAGAIPDAAVLLMRVGESEAALERAADARDRLARVLATATETKTGALALFGMLRAFCAASGSPDAGFGRELRILEGHRRQPEWTDLEIAADHLIGHLRGVMADLAWFMQALTDSGPFEPESPMEVAFDEGSVGLLAAAQTLGELAERLRVAVLQPDSGSIYWIAISPNGERTSLQAAPLNVGPLLKEHLYDQMQTVVLTSATLTTDGRFDFMRDRLALTDADELTFESPFDYRRSALLYLVDDVPEPNQPGYQTACEETIVEASEALGGRTLALFTSHGALRSTYRAIAPILREQGIDVLAQGIDGSPAQLVERLRSAPNTVVLGTSTFWEGVDVVGPALSALIITKLPFNVPSDPVFSARGELMANAFMEYAVPQAVLRFKQGFGRLIRSSRDRGICITLDRRLISKRYGSSFVTSLPPCTVHHGSRYDVADAIGRWLNTPREETRS